MLARPDDFLVTPVATYHRAFVKHLTPSALLAHARSEGGQRALRYMATSAFGVVTTQVLLFAFLHAFGWKPVISNFTAVTLTSIPAFLLNKYWVWGKRGRAHMRREVLPFWLFTVAGWILSTLAVVLVVNITKDPTNPDLVDGNKYAVQAANIAGFGILWVLKYLFLDKIMFGAHHHTPYDEDIEAEEEAAAVAPEAPAPTQP
ncbi:MAG: GtrA family protein [Acidimicrobiales bacterium]|nr:GtrA family protein [Acidimicrobiales bacterium]